jgi:HTH-type transcriptional regulator / antitoxin HigA
VQSEADYEAALVAIERFFEREPKPHSLEADEFDLLARAIAEYERRRWPINPPTPGGQRQNSLKSSPR